MILIEDNKIRIQDFKQILRMSEKYIIVSTKEKRVAIEGENMFISYLEKHEIIICGNFSNITFLKGDING